MLSARSKTIGVCVASIVGGAVIGALFSLIVLPLISTLIAVLSSIGLLALGLKLLE